MSDQPDAFDAYHRWLGISPKDQPPNHYRLLGIDLFENDPEVIRDATERQSGHVRRYQLGRHMELSQKILNEIAAAKVCLTDPDEKAAYDDALREAIKPAQPVVTPEVPTPAYSSDPLIAPPADPVPAPQPVPPVVPPQVSPHLPPPAASVAWMRATPFGKQPVRSKAKRQLVRNAILIATAIVVVLLLGVLYLGFVAEQQPIVHNDVQKQDVERLKAPVELTNSVGMKLVLIPAGEFDMGSTPEEVAGAIQEATQQNDTWGLDRIPSEVPRHRIRISRPFYLGMYEVTQGEYAQVMGSNPSSFSAKGKDAGGVVGQDTSRRAVEMVSWDDAAQFCQKLSLLPQERTSRRMYRLPTEAEWEYAARAGSTTKWSFGDDPAALGDHAWFKSNSDEMTHPVGQKKPNAWGLYDMYGNVYEWCQDWYNQTYYATSPKNDPTGPSSGSERVLRGGSWGHIAWCCRSAVRGSLAPGFHHSDLGLRVVLVAE